MFFPGDDSKNEKGTQEPDAYEQALLADKEDAAPKIQQDASSDKRDNTEASQSGVRFATDDEEIDPLDDPGQNSRIGGVRDEDLSPETHEQIKTLAMSLQKSRLQENRMANFAYETVSMPPSRVREIFLSFGFLLTRASGPVQR